MPLIGFRSRHVAETLNTVARERMVLPKEGIVGEEPRQQALNIRRFLVVFDEDVEPIATYDAGSTWQLGEGFGVIWVRESNIENVDSGENSSDPDNTELSYNLIPLRDANNQCVRVRVFNPLRTQIPACVPTPCTQDNFGDIYIEEIVADVDGTPPTTETTTTSTLGPCAARCKWTWNAAGSYWTLTEDNCNTTTTSSSTTTSTSTSTSSSTTTSTSSSTTTPDCHCSSTTTTGTTSQPTVSPCQCQYPDHCGTSDGECTYTLCGSGDAGVHVSCTSTTTSTTAAGTTTTCDCNTTTTTTAAACSDGCDWLYVPLFGWRKVSDGCAASCPCSNPTVAPDPCAEEHTPCVPISTTVPPTPPSCGGNCTWVWVPPQSAWLFVSSNCVQGVPNGCFCTQPTEDGTECLPYNFPCQAPTTTTGTPTTPGPCANCYTTTSTSTTTPSPGDCPGSCKWSWSESIGAWTGVVNNCEGECGCPLPAYDGLADCEVTWTRCYGGTTSTTTTSETTTTTGTPPTTETTTTTTCCFGSGWAECYACCQGGTWTVCRSTCGVGDYECDWNQDGVGGDAPPSGACGPTDVVRSRFCAETTTSTTTSTTTTTQAPGCTGNCSYQCVLVAGGGYDGMYVWQYASSDCEKDFGGPVDCDNLTGFGCSNSVCADCRCYGFQYCSATNVAYGLCDAGTLGEFISVPCGTTTTT